MEIDHELEHVGPDRLGEALGDAHVAALLKGLCRVVGSDCHDHHLGQARVLGAQAFLVLEYLLGSLDAVHAWHVDVRENDAVADVAARLRHVL